MPEQLQNLGFLNSKDTSAVIADGKSSGQKLKLHLHAVQASMLEIYNEEYKDLLGKALPAGKKHQVHWQA